MRFSLYFMLLLQLLGTLVTPASASEFLAPNQAFRIAARTETEGRLLIRFDIAPGHYMYREAFRVVDQSGQSLNLDGLPKGERKYDAAFEREMEIHRDQLSLPLALPAGTSKLLVTGQGCADKGLCYAPMTSTLVPDPSQPDLWKLQTGADPEGEFGVATVASSPLKRPLTPSVHPKLAAFGLLFTAIAGLLLASRKA